MAPRTGRAPATAPARVGRSEAVPIRGPWRAVPQASFPRPFSLTDSSIFSTSGLTFSRKRASASSGKPGSQAADWISREKPLTASRKPRSGPSSSRLTGSRDVGQARFLEHRRAFEEVGRDPAVAPPRGARLRGRQEAVARRLADEVPGQVVEERLGRSVGHRVHRLIEELPEQVGEIDAVQKVASPTDGRVRSGRPRRLAGRIISRRLERRPP